MKKQEKKSIEEMIRDSKIKPKITRISYRTKNGFIYPLKIDKNGNRIWRF